MKILSIDSATKNIGVCYGEYDTDWKKKFNTLIKLILEKPRSLKYYLNGLQKLNTIIDNIFTLEFINWYDLIPGKKLAESGTVERARRLKSILESWDVSPDVILVEHQMGPNVKSRTVSNQIVYHYSTSLSGAMSATGEIKCHTRKMPEIILVNPTLKNTVSFDSHHYHSIYKSKFRNKASNKNHAVANFNIFFNMFPGKKLISQLKVPKFDDIADSFMMAISWCLHNH